MKKAVEHIKPLSYHTLRGRVLRLPATKSTKRQLLFVYGSHASIERMIGVAEIFTQSANVTLPDLPGFGGMDSLYKIHRKASFDELGDYLAWFIRKHYTPDTKIDIVGMSLGFAIVTRMLQRHPDLTTYVNHLISYVGMANYRDFRMKPWKRHGLIAATWLFEHRPSAWLMRHTFCTRPILRLVYGHTNNEKFRDVDFNSTLDMEVKLWQINNVQTYNRTVREMFQLNDRRPIDLPVIHIASPGDRYFNNDQVAKSMRQIYKSFKIIKAQTDNHAPSVIATADDAKVIIPPELLKLLDS